MLTLSTRTQKMTDRTASPSWTGSHNWGIQRPCLAKIVPLRRATFSAVKMASSIPKSNEKGNPYGGNGTEPLYLNLPRAFSKFPSHLLLDRSGSGSGGGESH